MGSPSVCFWIVDDDLSFGKSLQRMLSAGEIHAEYFGPSQWSLPRSPFLSLQRISEAEASRILIFVSVLIDEGINAGKRRMPVLSVRSILENDL